MCQERRFPPPSGIVFPSPCCIVSGMSLGVLIHSQSPTYQWDGGELNGSRYPHHQREENPPGSFMSARVCVCIPGAHRIQHRTRGMQAAGLAMPGARGLALWISLAWPLFPALTHPTLGLPAAYQGHSIFSSSDYDLQNLAHCPIQIPMPNQTWWGKFDNNPAPPSFVVSPACVLGAFCRVFSSASLEL